MKTEILVVVDMQGQFLKGINSQAKQVVIANIVKLIERANRYKWPVVLVEFLSYGATIPEIKNVCERHWTVVKDEQDGSQPVQFIVERQKLIADRFRVCGLYAGQCVLQTANGLAKRFPNQQVRVLREACDHYQDDNHTWLLYEKRKLDNLRVISNRYRFLEFSHV